MNHYMICLLTFLVSIPTAFVWIHYIHAVNKHKAFSAAAWAALIFLFGNVAVVQLWHEAEFDVRALLSALAGDFIGTYFTVKFHKENHD